MTCRKESNVQSLPKQHFTVLKFTSWLACLRSVRVRFVEEAPAPCSDLGLGHGRMAVTLAPGGKRPCRRISVRVPFGRGCGPLNSWGKAFQICSRGLGGVGWEWGGVWEGEGS